MTSTLHTFLHSQKNLLLHFLEGKNLVADIEQIHSDLSVKGINFLKKTTLSILPLISLLKEKESFGLYLDSDVPPFTYKLEAKADGSFRTLLLPLDFQDFPQNEELTGKARFIKKAQQEKAPYLSIIPLETTHIDQVVNQLLHLSYQIHSKIILSSKLEYSLMMSSIPPQSGTKSLGLEEFQSHVQLEMEEFLSTFQQIQNPSSEQVISQFLRENWQLLQKRPIFYHCSCSKEYMKDFLIPLFQQDPLLLFSPEQLTKHDPFSLNCDYCKKLYSFLPSDFLP